MSKQDKKELRQQIACEWLEENYLNYGSLRHDVVTDRLQIRVADSLSAPHNATSVIGDPAEDGSAYCLEFRGKETWRNLTDKDINTMVCQCVAEKGVNISTNEMWTALKSDMVPAVHPLRAWLDELRPYTADQPDWIDFVASQVRVKANEKTENMINDNTDNLRGNQLPAALKENIPFRSRDIDSSGCVLVVGDNKNDNTDNLRPNQYSLGAHGENNLSRGRSILISLRSNDRLCRTIASGILSKLSSNNNSPLSSKHIPVGARSAADVETQLTQLLLQTQNAHEEIILEVIDFRPGTELGYNTPCSPELQKP